MKPTVPEVLPLVVALYERHGAGCCLHIVLDDDNVEDRDVQFCLEWARKNRSGTCRDQAACVELAEKLLLMSRTQRLKLSGLVPR